jgi:hypothetical protein
MILGIDVGGTFTDFVLLDDAGRVRSHKLRTSARDPLTAILQVAFFCLGGMLWCYLVCLSSQRTHAESDPASDGLPDESPV